MSDAAVGSVAVAPSQPDGPSRSGWVDALCGPAGTEEPAVELLRPGYLPDGTAEPTSFSERPATSAAVPMAIPAPAARPLPSGTGRPATAFPIKPRPATQATTAARPLAGSPSVWAPSPPSSRWPSPPVAGSTPPRAVAGYPVPTRPRPVGPSAALVVPNRMPSGPVPPAAARSSAPGSSSQRPAAPARPVGSAPRPVPPSGARRSRASTVVSVVVFLLVLVLASGLGRQIVELIQRAISR